MVYPQEETKGECGLLRDNPVSQGFQLGIAADADGRVRDVPQL